MFQINHRRVATIPPLQKRVLNSDAISKNLGKIKWVDMPAWYEDFKLGRIG